MMNWVKEKSISDDFTPEMFEEAESVYAVLESYVLNNGKEWLKVQHAVSRSESSIFIANSVNVIYDSPDLCESLRIKDGSIFDAETYIPQPFPDDFEGFDFEKEFHEGLQNFLTPLEVNPPTYHNIKRFEDQMKQLPAQFQDQLSAIYQGNGVFCRE